MSDPLALVLFGGGGGVDCGLERAGFRTVAVDWCPSQRERAAGEKKPQDATQHYAGAGELHMADLSTAEAVAGVIAAFKPDLVTSSPPCQKFSDATPTANRGGHPDLIASTRAGILASGVPGWIENVASKRVPFTGFWVMLCGSMFPETYHLERHRRFEILRWKIAQPWHNDALCWYGSDAHDAASCALCADFGVSDERRVVTSIHDGSIMSNSRAAIESRDRNDVSVAGKGPQGALDGPREVVTLLDGAGRRGSGRRVRDVCSITDSGGTSSHEDHLRQEAARRRETIVVTGQGGASTHEDHVRQEAARREVVSVIGTNGSTPAFGGDKERRAEFRAGRTCVGVFGGALDGPGQLLGQNRAGPKAIRWRQAMGWLDGPQDRYALSQAVPPCYAEFLGRKFLERA